MALEYFPCFYSYAKKTANLSDSEVGRLFRSLMEYGENGVRPELNGREAVAFDFIADDIDRSKSAYAEKCESNRRNIGRRYSDSTNVYDRIQPYTNEYERIPKATKPTKQKQNTKPKENTSPNGEEDALSRSLDEFRSYRKQIGKKLTPLAETRLMNELEKLSGGDKETKIEILNRSIMNGWTGVFPLKEQKKRDYEEHPVQPGKFDHLFVDLDGD